MAGRPALKMGKVNVHRVLTIFDLYHNKNLSQIDIAQQMGLSRQAIGHHLAHRREMMDRYEDMLRTMDDYSNDEKTPENLKIALKDALEFFPMFYYEMEEENGDEKAS